jgi:hypothetical protein
MTLPAPPERVWPWLVQMGGDRAGWYGWDWLDNGGRPSADRIAPKWLNLAKGQRVDSLPKGQNWLQRSFAHAAVPAGAGS